MSANLTDTEAIEQCATHWDNMCDLGDTTIEQSGVKDRTGKHCLIDKQMFKTGYTWKRGGRQNMGAQILKASIDVW